jgi:hypothetical protein
MRLICASFIVTAGHGVMALMLVCGACVPSVLPPLLLYCCADHGVMALMLVCDGSSALMVMVLCLISAVVQVMVLWLLAYIIIGQVAMPICLSMMGMSADDLSARGHALMHLCLDVAQVCAWVQSWV